VNSNLVDSTTIHGVDSLFRPGKKDPWGRELAGRLADFFIYSEVLRYPAPDRGDHGVYDIAMWIRFCENYSVVIRKPSVRCVSFSGATPRR